MSMLPDGHLPSLIRERVFAQEVEVAAAVGL
jgi:hypothetical protein